MLSPSLPARESIARSLLQCLAGLLMLGWSGLAFAVPPELLQAYKKEFAFLQAQKQALLQRLQTIDRKGKARIQRSEAKLRAMQQKLMWTRESADRVARSLQSVSQRHTTQRESKALMEKVVERARFALEQGGHSLPKTGKPAAILEKAFAKSAKLLRQSSQIRAKKGSFFLPNGSRTHGTILSIGGIASYGISPQARGALAPAGNGRLKLWPKDASKTAAALMAGTSPSHLQIFLYENLSKEIAFKSDKTLLQFIHAGGVIGWIIVALGLLAGLLLLLRVLLLWRATGGLSRLLGEVEALIGSGQREEALVRCEKSAGASARVLEQTVRHLDKDRRQLEELVSESLLNAAPTFECFATIIAVTAAVAPLLGLLGTVTGMISTFDVITEYGTGDPKLLAGGISEALITTKLGLIVAIPALFLGSLLSGRAEALLQRLEWGALHLINLAHVPGASHVPKASHVSEASLFETSPKTPDAARTSALHPGKLTPAFEEG